MSDYNNGVYTVDDFSCVSNTKVFGLEDSIRRAKYPMSVEIDTTNSELTDGIKKLAQSGAGEGEDNWLNGVIVQFDLTFTVKGWTEAERYHFFDFVSSQSTMHRIARFDLDKAYIKYVDPRIVQIMKEKVAAYNRFCESSASASVPRNVTLMAEVAARKREMYLEILYSNPTGFQLTAGMTTNYRQLKTIYRQRKNHRLPEWRDFCRWIESLPHSELITGKTAA